MDERFKHHPPLDTSTIKAHETVRFECDYLFDIINAVVPEGRERSIAITKLEECMMWSNAGIARNQ